MNGKIIFSPVFNKEERALYRSGSINLDVDTLVSDLDSGLWTQHDMKLADISWRLVVPRILDFFKLHNIKATFFVIGKHLEIESCRECIAEMIKQGHEIGNHTMTHNKQFSLLSKDEIQKEIIGCHEQIEKCTGKPPVGFRAPGYTITHNVIKVLSSLDYAYDASLNLSKSYNLVKWFYKHCLIKEKGFLALQNFKGFPKTDQACWVSPEIHTTENHPFLLFPINIIPFISYPFVSGTLIQFGYSISRLSYNLFRRRMNVLNFELHDCEFLKSEDIEKENVPHLSSLYIKIPFEKRLNYFKSMFDLFNKDVSFKTLGHIAKELQREYYHRQRR